MLEDDRSNILAYWHILVLWKNLEFSLLSHPYLIPADSPILRLGWNHQLISWFILLYILTSKYSSYMFILYPSPEVDCEFTVVWLDRHDEQDRKASAFHGVFRQALTKGGKGVVPYRRESHLPGPEPWALWFCRRVFFWPGPRDISCCFLKNITDPAQACSTCSTSSINLDKTTEALTSHLRYRSARNHKLTLLMQDSLGGTVPRPIWWIIFEGWEDWVALSSKVNAGIIRWMVAKSCTTKRVVET